jgi:hypothetical protein
MLLKLAVLGVLGYAGFRYYEKTLRRSARRPELAGGPLSSEARLQSSPDMTTG